MSTLIAIGRIELRRFLTDRGNLFFTLIFPLALVLVIGTQFGGGGNDSAGRVGITGDDPAGTLHTSLVERWEDANLEVQVDADADALREAVARGVVDVGVVLTAETERAFSSGEPATVEYIDGTGQQVPAVSQLVRAEGEQLGLRAGQEQLLAETLGVQATDAQQALDAQAASSAGPALVIEQPDGSQHPLADADPFAQGAGSQLLLFVFLNTLGASVAMIQARRHGVLRRIAATPTTKLQIMSGFTLGRLAIAVFQGGYIMVATWLLFDVDWGNLVAMATILVIFGLVAAGLAMLIGVVVDNEGLATGLAVGGGLVTAAIGGAMFPLELFGDTLRTVAHLTPHAWAYQAIAEVQRHDGGVLDILPQLGVLAAMAVGALALGALALRRSLERAM